MPDDRTEPTTPTWKNLPAPASRSKKKRHGLVVVGVTAGALLALLAGSLILTPKPPTLAAERTGDPQLSEWLATNLDDGTRDTVVTAVITPEGTRFAGLGADEDDEFEIGSVTKTITSLLLAQAVERGEVSLDDRLGSYLDLGDSAAADVTLEELSTHRSGLPRLAMTPGVFITAQWKTLTSGDPYPYDLADLEEHARSVALENPGTVSYSNLGVALLGQALASAVGVEYADLVDERVFTPLGMTSSSVPTTPDGLAEDAPTGWTDAGREAAAWTMGAYAPAGGIRSTATDMAAYADALLTTDADGPLGVDPATVLDPRHEAGPGQSIGLAWFANDAEQASPDSDPRAAGITWHNGGTGGYGSMLALDREAGVAVLMIGNTANTVDLQSFTLLHESR